MATDPVPTPTPIPEAPAPDRRRVPGLVDVPPEIEWFANLGNQATHRAYQTSQDAWSELHAGLHTARRVGGVDSSVKSLVAIA
jgi:hypothetical protein